MGGGGNNRAAEEANRMEQERRAAIAHAQGRINQVFDNPQRAADIADFVDATRSYYGDELNRQKADSDRELRFALARGGLFGGSTQRDQQSRLGEDYSRGLLRVDQMALGAGAELEAADQDARGRLIQLATSGLDATTGAQQAAAAMRSNLQASRPEMRANQLGEVFGGVRSFADQARDAAERRRANRDAGFNLYGPSAATGHYYGGGW